MKSVICVSYCKPGLGDPLTPLQYCCGQSTQLVFHVVTEKKFSLCSPNYMLHEIAPSATRARQHASVVRY